MTPAAPASPSQRRRRGAVAIPALAAGGLAGASLPPGLGLSVAGLWPLAWAGLGLLCWRLRGLGARARLLAGLLAGIAFFAITFEFLASFNLAGYAAVVVMEALFFAGACILVPPGRGRLLAFPAAMTLAEAARSIWPVGGLPIAGLPLGQAGGPLLATSRLGGPLLVMGLSALGGAALAALAESAAERRARPLLAGALALVLGAGLVAAGKLAPDGHGAGQVRVALVQGGGKRGFQYPRENPELVYLAQLQPTRHLKAPLGLVLWPENAVALQRPLAGSAVSSQLAAEARRLRATLVAGITQPSGRTRFLNYAVAYGPSGRMVGRYEKVKRVPFGEYVPLRGLFSRIVNLDAVPRDEVPGHGTGLVRTPAGPLGLMISFEVFFSNRARGSVRDGAQLLVVPTNTASYATRQAPSEELAADRLRAVEEGRMLVQASTTGYTDVVGPAGQVLRRSSLGVPDVVRATVQLRGGLTPYGRAGDLPVLALSGLMTLAAWGMAARRGRPAGRRT